MALRKIGAGGTIFQIARGFKKKQELSSKARSYVSGPRARWSLLDGCWLSLATKLATEACEGQSA